MVGSMGDCRGGIGEWQFWCSPPIFKLTFRSRIVILISSIVSIHFHSVKNMKLEIFKSLNEPFFLKIRNKFKTIQNSPPVFIYIHKYTLQKHFVYCPQKYFSHKTHMDVRFSLLCEYVIYNQCLYE